MSYDRIATLLASNLKPSQVASIVGLSPARISQLLQQEEFKTLVASKQAMSLQDADEEEAVTTKYSAVEHLLLNQMMDLIPISEMKDVTQALRVVAERQEKAKTRIAPIYQGNIVNNQAIIQLSLPNHAIPEILMSSTKEVIAIGALELAPLSSAGVTSLFASLATQDSKKENYHVQDSTSTQASGSLKEALPFGQAEDLSCVAENANEF